MFRPITKNKVQWSLLTITLSIWSSAVCAASSISSQGQLVDYPATDAATFQQALVPAGVTSQGQSLQSFIQQEQAAGRTSAQIGTDVALLNAQGLIQGTNVLAKPIFTIGCDGNPADTTGITPGFLAQDAFIDFQNLSGFKPPLYTVQLPCNALNTQQIVVERGIISIEGWLSFSAPLMISDSTTIMLNSDKARLVLSGLMGLAGKTITVSGRGYWVQLPNGTFVSPPSIITFKAPRQRAK